MSARCRRLELVRAAIASAALGLVATDADGQQLVSRVARAVAEHEVRFEANRGQADPRIRYLARARDYTVALTADEALLLLRKPAASPSAQTQPNDVALVRMRLVDASPTARITAADPLPGNVYFAASRARGPLRPIDTFARIQYAGVYPGIDLVYYGNDRQLEFDFLLSPLADPRRIALAFDGVDDLRLSDGGDLVMRAGGASVTLAKPLVYQERDGHRIEIPAAYLLPTDATHTVRFRLGEYDRSLPLVIDPSWMTVFGSTSDDLLSGFAVDAAGHPRLIGTTFDPATFPFTHLEPGQLPAPICFLTRLDDTGHTIYTILFENTQRCGTLALSPGGVAYFTAYVSPNAYPGDRGTTVTSVDDRFGPPMISRFEVGGYDSSATGRGVDALAVNGLEHVFVLGASGTGAAHDPVQPLLTVLDSSGAVLHSSVISPGDMTGKYGLAADDNDRAYIVGSRSSVLAPTADAYRSECPEVARSIQGCKHLIVLDTTEAPGSPLYSSYLWNSDDGGTVVVRLGPGGEVYLAGEGAVFGDFPGNRPSIPASWPYSLFPALMNGIQVARFDRDATGAPNQLNFAMVFDPSRGVAALDGLTVRDTLADLRLFPSGAPAIATIAETPGMPPLGVVTSFERDGDGVGEVWTQNLGTRSARWFGLATGSASLYLAGHADAPGAADTDVFVEHIDAVDPGANRPPTVRIFGAPLNGDPLIIYAQSAAAGGLLQLTANAFDPDGDALTYSWTGPFTDNPDKTSESISARVALGAEHTVTVTVDDGHGNVVSVNQVFRVLGTPFAGTTATPVDSEVNGLISGYAPLTITATAIGADGGNAYLRTRLDQDPPIPADLQAGSPPIYFDVSADAVLGGPFNICVDTSGMSFASPANIRLYHSQRPGQPGAWVDITSPAYPQGKQLCGRSTSLGTFAIFYPQVPPTRVETVAGNGVRAGGLDGPGGNPEDDYSDGPATATPLPYLMGGAFDRANNLLYISTAAEILRLALADNTIARVAGNDAFLEGVIDGPGGDPRDDLIEGGDPFNSFVGQPFELAVAPNGDLVFIDRSSCRIRRLDMTQRRLFTVAGNGTCGFSGDGSPAIDASLSYGAMTFDTAGHLFLADQNHARIRRIDAVTNVIDTVAGDGTVGAPANGSPRSTIGAALGVAFDAQGHLLIAASLHLLRLSPGANGLVDGDAGEAITVLTGCNTNCIAPLSGDGLALSSPHVYTPGSGHVAVTRDGSILSADMFRVRRISPGTDGIVTGAGDEIISTVAGYYDFATASLIPNFNGDTFATQSLFSGLLYAFDTPAGIVVVDTNNARVRRFGLPPAPANPNSADLAVAAIGAPDPVTTNGSLRYDVVITNQGPATAGAVTMTYVIPAGAVLAGTAGTIACSAPPAGSAGTVTCNFGALAAGASGTVAVTITPQTAGTLSSTFTVAGLEEDPNAANNSVTVATAVIIAPALIDVSEVITVIDAVAVRPSAVIGVVEQIVVSDAVGALPATMIAITEQVTVTDTPHIVPGSVPPDLSLAVVPSRTLIVAGESLTYTVTVVNHRADAAPGAFFTILPGGGFVIDSTTLPACTVAGFSGLWSCALGSIAPAASMQFSVTGRVTGGLPGTNMFAVNSASPDATPANNTANVAFDARPTVTINQAAAQSDPATASPINFSVVFSESVSGFGGSDISFAGSAIGGPLVATVTGSGASYNVAVTGMVGVGTVNVSIPAAAAVDSGGNPNAASTSNDSSVLFGVATAVAMVSPGNGGNAALTVLKFGNSINGILFYARGTTLLTATRFTSLVIDGQTAIIEGFSTANRFFVVRVRDGGTGQADSFRLWIDGAEQTDPSGAIATGTVLVQPWAPDTRLKGWVDLHTHPMSNLAFGGKLFHGAPSVGSLMPAVQMPADPQCRIDQRATNIVEALSQDAPTRGDRFQSICGDNGRNLVIKAVEAANGALTAPAGAGGYPLFTHWPKWNDITHQKMWVDWIRRSWEGGQRVMVALSHNNKTLADLLGSGGHISGVKDDRASSDLQIAEIRRLVTDHQDFMGLATTPAELHAIVQGGRLAVVLGMEVDKIGNFSPASPPSNQAIDAEIARLHALGVRYILPVHFVDNAFGDTAVDEPLFNILNVLENQSPLSIGCAVFSDEIGFRWPGIPGFLAFLGAVIPNPPSCQFGSTFAGHVNTRTATGLTAAGEYAVRAMMRRGIIVDIDHMSNRAANRTLAIANAVPNGGYPVTSGHSAIRERSSPQFNSELSRTTTQLARIACLGGMFGLGTDSAGAHRWAGQYERAYNVMRRAFAPGGECPNVLPLGAGFVALGTDANSLVKTPVPPLFDPGGLPRFVDIYNADNPINAGVPPLARSRTDSRTWDYNVEGVAHYGMFVDFLRDVRFFNQPGRMPGRQMVDEQMMYGADYFYQMWLKADAQKLRVP